jgi:hypothetical protein
MIIDAVVQAPHFRPAKLRIQLGPNYVVERSPLLAEVVDEDNRLIAVLRDISERKWEINFEAPIRLTFPDQAGWIGHGYEAACPNCKEPGTLDLFGREIHFENSIWWDDYRNTFECCRCSKEID